MTKSERGKKHYAVHRESILARQKTHYDKQGREVKRRYYLSHYEDIADKKRTRYLKNRDKIVKQENERYLKNRSAVIQRRNAVYGKKRTLMRETCLNHYGRVCACCGESNVKFLSVDHMNGGGLKHRKECNISNMWEWLVKNDFPDGFQLLCYNCNCGKRVNGGVCPHASNGD